MMLGGGKVLWLLPCAILALAGCGSDEHPDTGYGANEPVPTTLTCNALCARLADCATQLCNEDTSSSNYDGLEPFLIDNCETTCTDAAVQSKFTAAEWSCTFMSSCREVLDFDACMNDSHYTCE